MQYKAKTRVHEEKHHLTNKIFKIDHQLENFKKSKISFKFQDRSILDDQVKAEHLRYEEAQDSFTLRLINKMTLI